VSEGETSKMAGRVEALDERWHRSLRPIGTFMVDVFHYIGLFLIGAATVWAAGWSFIGMMQKKPYASVEDLLLLFIFLEIGAMVGIYFKTNHMPVRFLLYVAITAVTRHIVGVVNHIPVNVTELVATAGGILLLAIALLAVRFASFKYPAGPVREPSFQTDLEQKRSGRAEKTETG